MSTPPSEESAPEPIESAPPGHPEVELAMLASLLRRAMPRVPDQETAERLERAWVAVTNAVKQPKVDAVRLGRRLRQLRGELESLISRHDSDAASDDGGDADEQESETDAESTGAVNAQQG